MELNFDHANEENDEVGREGPSWIKRLLETQVVPAEIKILALCWVGLWLYGLFRALWRGGHVEIFMGFLECYWFIHPVLMILLARRIWVGTQGAALPMDSEELLQLQKLHFHHARSEEEENDESSGSMSGRWTRLGWN